MNYLIIVAAGSGSRMKSKQNKIFLKIQNHPLIYWTLKTFEESPLIDKIVIVAKKEEQSRIQNIIKKYKFSKIINVISGGETRSQTVFNGLNQIKNITKPNDLIGIHNAVNIFVNNLEIKSVYQAAKTYHAALLAINTNNTIKISDEDNLVVNTPPRQFCWSAQTPQVAEFNLLYAAYQKVINKNIATTDDSQVLELNGIKPKLVPCSPLNFKITYPQDLLLAKSILKINKT